MLRIALVAASLMVSGCLAYAQLSPPSRTLQAVNDPMMVVNDRGSQLEVYATKRAALSAGDDGRATHQVVASAATTPFVPTRLGVVFNHAMQAQGLITGEIGFVLKPGTHADDATFPPSLYPGLAKVTSPNVYLVKAATPSAFVLLLKTLQARNDIEAVEPVVLYERQSTSSAR